MMFAFIEFLPAGGFWCKPELVEATDDDVLARSRDELPELQASLIALRLQLAANELLYRSIEGSC